jgi:hypothetical protein
MEPILVPSLCLLIREATRVALIGRWGPVHARWRAYSPTVTRFASPMYAPDNLASSTAVRCRSALALRVIFGTARDHHGRATARYL